MYGDFQQYYLADDSASECTSNATMYDDDDVVLRTYLDDAKKLKHIVFVWGCAASEKNVFYGN